MAEENVRGRYVLEQRDDGAYLTVYPPKGEGMKVDFATVRQDIMGRGLLTVDMDTVEKIVSDASGETYKITEDAIRLKNIEIEVSTDHMKAYATIYPPEEGEEPATFDDVFYKLRKVGVKFGIKKDVIKHMVGRMEQQGPTIVAEGEPAINGEDAKLMYMFDVKKRLKPVELEDGRVDHHNLDIINNVGEGTVLVVKVPFTEGKIGRTVLGEPLRPKPGRDVPLPKGDNTRLSEDGLELIAAANGHRRVVFIGGEVYKIHIDPVFVVSKDVDYETGNINFMSSVHIMGSVRDGFKVQAGGDVEIKGTVEKAEIISTGGTIVVQTGVQGHGGAYLQAQKEVRAKYIQDARIVSYGDVFVTTMIRHSNVDAKNNVIVVDNKGGIVGGLVRAGGEIDVKNIGSPSYTPTEVRIEDFTKEEKEKQLEELEEKIEEGEENLKKLAQVIALLRDSGGKLDNLPPEKKAQLMKQVQIYPRLQEQVKTLKEERARLQAELRSGTKGRIRVADTIYPGVKIVIGKSVLKVDQEMRYVSIYEEGGELKKDSYR